MLGSHEQWNVLSYQLIVSLDYIISTSFIDQSTKTIALSLPTEQRGKRELSTSILWKRVRREKKKVLVITSAAAVHLAILQFQTLIYSTCRTIDMLEQSLITDQLFQSHMLLLVECSKAIYLKFFTPNDKKIHLQRTRNPFQV